MIRRSRPQTPQRRTEGHVVVLAIAWAIQPRAARHDVAARRATRRTLLDRRGLHALDQTARLAVEDLAQHDQHTQVQPLGATEAGILAGRLPTLRADGRRFAKRFGLVTCIP